MYETREYEANDTILKEGELGRGFCILDEGVVDSSFIQADGMVHPASVPMEAAQASRHPLCCAIGDRTPRCG